MAYDSSSGDNNEDGHSVTMSLIKKQAERVQLRSKKFILIEMA